MKKTFLALAIFSVTSVTLAETPLSVLLKAAEETAKGLRTSEEILRAEIERLDQLAAEVGAHAGLDPTDIGKLHLSLSNVRKALGPVSLTIYSLKNAFEAAELHSPRADKHASISALFSSVDRELGFIAQGLSDFTLNDTLAALKQKYFTLVDTTGHLILSLRDAVELSPPQAEQLKQIETFYGVLLETFHRGSEAILHGPEKSFGDRTVSYVSGSTMAFAHDFGPSPLSASDALNVEKRVISRLAGAIEKLQGTKVAVLESKSLFAPPSAQSCHKIISRTAE